MFDEILHFFFLPGIRGVVSINFRDLTISFIRLVRIELCVFSIPELQRTHLHLLLKEVIKMCHLREP